MPEHLDPVHHLAKRLEHGVDYARQRRRRFSRAATTIRVTSLLLSASATVILGLADLTPEVGIAFTMTALVTLVNALEPFFNFRARWIIVEDGQAKFIASLTNLRFRVCTTSGALSADDIRDLHDEYQRVWEAMSDAWVEARRRGTPE